MSYSWGCQLELCNIIMSYFGDSVMYFGAIQILSRSIAVQELVRGRWGVSLVTVSCGVICFSNVSCDGTI